MFRQKCFIRVWIGIQDQIFIGRDNKRNELTTKKVNHKNRLSGQAHKSEKSNVLLIYIRFSWEWYRCDRNATTNPLEQKKIKFFIPKKSVSKKTAKNTHFRPIFFHNLSLQQDGAMKTGHNLDCGPPQLMEKKRGEIFF